MSQFIDGMLVEGNGPRVGVVNPCSEEEICGLSAASEQDVALAVAAAQRALPEWAALGGKKRAELIEKLAEACTADKPRLAKMETENQGKPIAEAEWDLDDVGGCLKYYAGLARALDDKQDSPFDLGMDDYKATLRYEPAGVAALVIPFNYPLLLACWKLGPSLAAGCTVVLKPSDLTPLSVLELCKLANKVGIPKGVINVVTGGADTGSYLVRHPDVAVVSFTGSVSTGIKVAQASAPLCKTVGLELGGKSSAIVFDDCDLEKTAEWISFGCFWTNGQICSATSRLLVQENVYDKVVAKVMEVAKGIKMCDPQVRDCRLGPLVSASQRDKVLGFVQKGVQEGATLLTGTGKRPTDKGFFVEPTMLKVNDENNICWREEIFGPVLSILSFKDEADAIKKANNSKYGLAAAVFSADQGRLTRVSNAMVTGIVWQNCSQPCFPQLPWGGPRLSGNGTRDLGEYGLHKYLEVKQVVRYSGNGLGWY